jgi:hypothetical protein
MRRGWRHLAVEKVENDENPWDGMDGMGWPIFSGPSLDIPSGKHTKSYGQSPFLMGKSTINGHFQ